MSRRDVENVNVSAAIIHALHGIADQLFEVRFPLTDAAPSDGVKVVAIDQSSDRRSSARFVFVDVIERAAGIESGFASEAQTFGQCGAGANAESRRAPIEAAR